MIMVRFNGNVKLCFGEKKDEYVLQMNARLQSL